MSLSQLQSAIAHYRQQIKAHEAQAEQALEQAYAQVLSTIQPMLDQFYQQIQDKLDVGEDIPLSWLYERNRLEAITAYIQGQINHFGMLAQMQVGQLQQQAVQLGQQAAQWLLQATVPTGIQWSFGTPSPSALAQFIGATQAGSPLADLFSGFGAEAARGVKDALITGLTLGYNPRDIAPSVQQALGISRNRALTISRTEMLRSYRGANLETFKANSDVVDQWRWTCALSIRTCAACIAMDGTLHDLSESMDSHPNCRCTMTPVTKSWEDILGPLGIDTTGMEDMNGLSIQQDGSDWFDGQSEATQRAILGPKYDAWSNGDFTLDDVVGHSSDPVWGDSIYEKPLKELVN